MRIEKLRPQFLFLISYFSFLLTLLILLPFNSYGDIENILHILEEKQKEIETWEAEFVQTKEISLMANKIISEGHMYFKKPNLIYWRYTKGSNLLMVFNGHEAWLYYPNLKEAERYKNIEGIMKMFPLAFGLELKDLKRYWDISLMPSPSDRIIALDLRPKGKDKRSPEFIPGFDKMTIWIEENRGAINKVQIFEPGGDNTIIEFKGIRLNEKLQDDLFTFKPPAGVKITSPLEEI